MGAYEPESAMKAIVWKRPGPPEVLQLEEVDIPTPGEEEVLIRIHAATVTRGDVVLRKLPFLVWLPMRVLIGLRRKRIPGHELAGVVEQTGRRVELFKVGDKVFGTTSGLGVGSCAEYVCLPASREGGVLARMPGNMTFAEAAAVPVGGLTALHFLRSGGIEPGQRVLIYGASGSVGTFAVQLARHFGAQVTGVCSTSNLELVRSLGAQEVIDYTEEDFAETGERYHLIFDAVGKTSPSDCERSLTSGGKFVSVQKGLAKERAQDLAFLRELMEEGAIRSVIDRKYPLEEVPEAHRYVEEGHKKGNVVVMVREEDRT